MRIDYVIEFTLDGESRRLTVPAKDENAAKRKVFQKYPTANILGLYGGLTPVLNVIRLAPTPNLKFKHGAIHQHLVELLKNGPLRVRDIQHLLRVGGFSVSETTVYNALYGSTKRYRKVGPGVFELI